MMVSQNKILLLATPRAFSSLKTHRVKERHHANNDRTKILHFRLDNLQGGAFWGRGVSVGTEKRQIIESHGGEE